MGNDIMFVGMDVHKKSIDITAAEDGHQGKVSHFACIDGDLKSLDKAIDKLAKTGKELHVVYEAGPCGFVIYRHLKTREIACTVVSPAGVPKKPGDRVKTDRRDSKTLAVQHRAAGSLRAIYVPEVEDEAMRDLIRGREDAVHNRRRARQRINSFLLRHGRSFSGAKKKWGAVHRRWLAEQYFDLPAQRITLEEYIGAEEESDARVERLTSQIGSLLEGWKWRPVVEALQALRGVQLLVAVTVMAEVGDLSRFTPTGLMAFLGMVPSEYTTGDKRRQGAITKTGNAHVRRVLCEASHAYRYTPALTQYVRQRQKDLPKEIRDIGWKAQLRLCGRYRHLATAGKHPHKIRMAIARELCGFMWDIACRVQGVNRDKPAQRKDVIVLKRRPRPAAVPGSVKGRTAPAPARAK
jgi:transposase